MAKKTINDARRPGEIFAPFGLKSAIGKTTVIRCLADLLDATGAPWRGVSVDRSERLPDRYPGRFDRILLPTDRDGRLDPYARTRAFAPLDQEIEALAENGGALLADIGSGEYPGAMLENAARTRQASLLKRCGVSITAMIVTTSDSVVMADAPRLAEAVLEVLPDARIVVVLNEKGGEFKFDKASEAHKVWVRDLEPLLAKHQSLTIPAMPLGTWDPYEDRGLRYSDVGLLDPAANIADEKKLIGWSREPRSLAVARQGDVAEWLHGAWQALAAIIQTNVGEGNDHVA